MFCGFNGLKEVNGVRICFTPYRVPSLLTVKCCDAAHCTRVKQLALPELKEG